MIFAKFFFVVLVWGPLARLSQVNQLQCAVGDSAFDRSCSLVQCSPRAIVHIGPHKTSSTHIQAFIARFATELQQDNLYWLQDQLDSSKQGTANAKNLAIFAAALRSPTDPYGTIPKMKAFFEEYLANNRNVVISSEELDHMPLAGVEVLKEMMSGFEVTIVYVYRELLSHMVSLHFESCRFEHNKNFSVPFSSYLFSTLDKMSVILDPAMALNPYKIVFGKDRITVVDMYGVAAANEDVVRVVVCEIAGALCSKGAAFFKADVSSNPSYSLLHSQVFSYYHAFVKEHNKGRCHFCNPKVYAAYKDFDAQLNRDMATKSAPVVPVLRSHLGMLVPMAERLDDQVRAEYGERILYGNATANQRAMREGVHVESLNAEEFVMSEPWNEYMQRYFKASLRVKGRMCDCDESR
jgi:hypothetical protein